MSELNELYQEVILEHSKAPRNFHDLANANHKAEGFNPLCGDAVHAKIHDEVEGHAEGDCAADVGRASLKS